MLNLIPSGRKLVLFAAAIAAALSGRVQADVLDVLPQNTLVVLKVNNLDAVSNKVAKLSKEHGLDQMQPALSDPLSALEETEHLTKGINKAGDMALALVDSQADKADPEKSLLILVPVADYPAFLKNFKAVKEDGAFSKVTPEDGPEMYLEHRGTYAALSFEKSVLADQPAGGLKLDGLAKREAAEKDAFVYANIEVIRVKGLAELKKARKNGLEQMTKLMGEAGGEGANPLKSYQPLVELEFNIAIDVAEQFLRDGRYATVGLGLGEKGIRLTVAADFEKGSTIGQLAGAMTNTDKPLLEGLPDRDYFMFGGWTSSVEGTSAFFNNVIGPLEDELGKSASAKAIIPAIDAWKKAALTVHGGASGLLAPSGNLGAESLLQQVVVFHGTDPVAVMKAQRDSVSAYIESMKSLPMGPVKMSSVYKKDAKTIEGVKFDSFESKMEWKADDMQAAMLQQIMGKVYGPNGTLGLLGQVDGSTSLFLQGASDSAVHDSIASAKRGKDVLSSRELVAFVSAELPKQRIGAFYLDLGTMAKTAISDAKAENLPVNVKLPNNLPPIGVTFGTEGNAFRIDAFIPSKLTEALMSAGLQVQQQSHDGPNGSI